MSPFLTTLAPAPSSLYAGHEHASAISLGTLKQGWEWYQQERLIVSVITVSALISEINHGHITKYNKVAPPTRTYSRALMGVGGEGRRSRAGSENTLLEWVEKE